MVSRRRSGGMHLALQERSICNCDHTAWKVHFARYIPHPSALSNFEAKRVSRHKKRSGTWLTASAPALLSVSSTGNKDCKLSVYIHGKVYEEHLASRVKFTWPQSRCRANCVSNGTPILFVSFCQKKSDLKSFEKGKFAMRFESAFHVNAFLSRAQELLLETESNTSENPPRSVITFACPEQAVPFFQPEILNPRVSQCGAISDASVVISNTKEIHSSQETVSNSDKVEKEETENEQGGGFPDDSLDNLCNFTALLQKSSMPQAVNPNVSGSVDCHSAKNFAGISTNSFQIKEAGISTNSYSCKIKEAHIPTNICDATLSEDKVKEISEAALFQDPAFLELYSMVERAWMDIESALASN